MYVIGLVPAMMDNGAVMMVGDVLEKSMCVMEGYIVEMVQMK